MSTEKNTMRELNEIEVKEVSGGFGGYISWNNKTGFHWGLFLGKKPGRG